ncbi:MULTISPECIES: hypothetical protein [Staphylococcus]|uniref:Uncharacterized protein n=2 Tax=Staphylococcus TaxID=1279 RepID=A0AAQ0MIA5_9STAP|nr:MULTISPECIES: hypothetical protein [Staphylococcus]MBM2658278.1 hypothetical protein [Staphylococcus pseudoxylosus]MBO3066054.1 hypothetical protein [Staphylococcus shinii]MCE5003332.1 hypothetical protein [Staphylococcus pseudoxylosus]MDW8547106.1 hypothetical protein [Staphylococcus pseudoxylosus]MDW8564377.1 hypothetical protein [Staphylococcus shinii]
MLNVVLSVLFIVAFIIICLLFQVSVGKFQQKRRSFSDKEVKIDNKSLWVGFYFYLFLGILIVIVHVFN